MFKLWDSKLFRRTFLSYIVILMVPTLLFYGWFYQQYKQVRIEEYQKQSLSVAESLDRKLLELSDFGNRIMSSGWLKRIRSQMSFLSDEYFTQARKLEIQETLQFYGTVNAISSDVAVYVPQKDLIINPSGWWESDLYLRYKNFEKNERAVFMEQIRGIREARLISPVSSQRKGERNDFYIIHSLDESQQGRALLIIQIRPALLDRFFTFNGNIASFSLEENGSEIYNFQGDGTAGETLSFLSKVFPNLSYEVQMEVPSGIDTLGPYTTYFVTFLVVMGLGLLIAYRLAVMSYKPIHVIAEKYGEKGESSEITAIEQSFQELMEQKEVLERVSSRYYDSARNQILQQLLYGYFGLEGVTNRLGEFDINYVDDGFFQVVYFGLPADQKEGLHILLNVNAMVASQHANIELVDGADSHEAMIFYFEKRPEDGFVEEQAQILRDHLAEKVENLPIITTGSLEKEIIGISKSYQKAKDSMENYFFPGQERSEKRSTAYFFPTDWEMQMVNQLKIGGEKSILAVLDQLWIENSKKNLPQSEWLSLINVVFESLRRVMHELSIETTALDEEFNRTLRQQSFSKQWEFIQKTAITICQRSSYRGNNEEDTTSQSIMEYLEKNYMNPDISLIQLANEFSVSTSTISRLFKNSMRLNFYNYLSRLRMEHAKLLLQENEDTIKTIGQQVGYENTYSFIRAFQRYEGITPKEYRDATREKII